MSSAPTGAGTPGPPDRMALLFQDVLTAIVRVRAGRSPVASGEGFRAQVLEALRAAEEEARRKGYTGEQARLAIFGIVAFLDETVLNSTNPAFRDWARKPLQEELFSGHVAGETFYQNVRELLMGDDSPRAADVLEIHQLCLCLGYRGRYSKGREAEVRAVQDRIDEKMERIRGAPAAPGDGQMPVEELPPPEAGVSKSLLFTAALAAFLALALFTIFRLALDTAISELRLTATLLPMLWGAPQDLAGQHGDPLQHGGCRRPHVPGGVRGGAAPMESGNAFPMQPETGGVLAQFEGDVSPVLRHHLLARVRSRFVSLRGHA